MRHETKSSDSFHLTLEVVAGGVGQSGLAASTWVVIYSVSAGGFWNFNTSAFGGWAGVDSAANMVETSATRMPGLYKYNAKSIYTANPAAASDGYVIRMFETTNSVLEYVSVAITDKMTIDANVISMEAASIDTNAMATGAIHTTAMAAGAIHITAIANDAIDAAVIADGTIDAATFVAGAIDADAIATDAIDADAVATAAITHLELGNFASQEISNAVWNADIFRPGYSMTGVPTDVATANTMGHAMLAQYLGQSLIHWNGTTATSIHKCSTLDLTGTKFYSDRLATDPISSDEIKSYIDKTVIIVKGLNLTTAPDAGTESYLGRITNVGTDGSGQFFEVKLTDEAGSAIPGGFDVTTDFLIVKGETDTTMHEVAHEVWEEPVLAHATADTFGMFSRVMTGLAQFNHRITSSTYDDSGRLLSCRLVVYPSATDAENQTNALTTVEVTSTYDEKQNMKTFLSKEG